MKGKDFFSLPQLASNLTTGRVESVGAVHGLVQPLLRKEAKFKVRMLERPSSYAQDVYHTYNDNQTPLSNQIILKRSTTNLKPIEYGTVNQQL